MLFSFSLLLLPFLEKKKKKKGRLEDDLAKKAKIVFGFIFVPLFSWQKNL